MSILNWVLIVVIVLLVIILIPCLYITIMACKAFEAIMPKLPSKPLWKELVDWIKKKRD